MRRHTRQLPNTTTGATPRSMLEPMNLVRVSPYRATWRCRCTAINTLYFSRTIAIGSVCTQVLHCKACNREFRGEYITDPLGRTA